MGKQQLAGVRVTLGQLVALFSHDPAQTGLLATVALAGVTVIGLWGLYGDLFLSNLVVVAIAEVLIMCYVGAVAVLIGRLVRSQDRWQVDSALTLRELLSERGTSAASMQAGSPLNVRRLHLRLEEEIRWCKQYRTPFSVVAMGLEVPGQAPSHAAFSQANSDMAELVTLHHKALVSPTSLGLFEYAFCLPNCDRRAAEAMTTFVANALRRYRCSFGVAVFPDDGEDAETLLRHATEQCGMLHSSAA